MGRDGVPGSDRGDAESLLPAELLLRDVRDPAVPGRLAHLLATATAPARPHELVGEETAVAAFRQARRAPVPAPGRRALLARLLTVKVAAAFAVTAAGGAAVAAAGGLPALSGTSGFSPRAAAPTVVPLQAPSITATHTSAPALAPRPPSASPTPAPQPPPENLCLALVSDPRNRQAGGEMSGLDSEALAALLRLAGSGAADIWSFCARLLGTVGAGGAPTGPAATPSGQPWDRFRTWQSYYPPQPQSPSQNQSLRSTPETAGRDTSPRPSARSAQASSTPVR